MKLRTVLPLGALTAVVLTSASMTHAGAGSEPEQRGSQELDSKTQEIRIGYRIAPVVLNTRGKNAMLVGLGSYIVNAQGGCNDCHTHPSFARTYSSHPLVAHRLLHKQWGH
jgi:hypothetical protein